MKRVHRMIANTFVIAIVYLLLIFPSSVVAQEVTHVTDKATNQPRFKVDPKAPFAHPYYWAPFILIGNWK